MLVLAYDRKLLDLVTAVLDQPCAERLLALVTVEMQGPVFAALEILDFMFAFDNKPQCRTLYPARRQAGSDFFPQQGRKIEADQVIKRPARLLCIHQRHGNSTGVRYGILDR